MGPEFHAAGKRLKDFERKFCSHSPAVSAAECLKEMVGMDQIRSYLHGRLGS